MSKTNIDIDKEIEAKKEELNKLITEIKSREALLEELKLSQKDSESGDIAALKKKIITLEDELVVRDNQIEVHLTKISKLQNNKENDNNNSEIEKLNLKIKELEHKNEELTLKNNNIIQENNNLIKEKEDIIKSFETGLKKDTEGETEKSIEQLNEEIKLNLMLYNEEKNKVIKLTEKIENLNNELLKQKEQVKEVPNNNDNDVITNLKKENKKLLDSIKEYTKNSELLTSKQNDFEAKFNDFHKKFNQLEAEKLELQKNMKIIANKKKKFEDLYNITKSNADSLEVKYTSSMKYNEEYHEKFLKLNKDLEKYRKTNNQFYQKNKLLESNIIELNSIIEKIRSENNNKNNEYNLKNEQIIKLGEEIRFLNKKLSKKEKYYENFKINLLNDYVKTIEDQKMEIEVLKEIVNSTKLTLNFKEKHKGNFKINNTSYINTNRPISKITIGKDNMSTYNNYYINKKKNVIETNNSLYNENITYTKDFQANRLMNDLENNNFEINNKNNISEIKNIKL